VRFIIGLTTRTIDAKSPPATGEMALTESTNGTRAGPTDAIAFSSPPGSRKGSGVWKRRFR
jgi:hypothetical protein